MLRDRIKAFAGYAGLVVVVCGTILVLVVELVNRGLPNAFTKYGSFFLVLVTLGYVIQNGQILREAKKERELTRKSLLETRKRPVIHLIVQAIDPILHDLRSDSSTFSAGDEQEDYSRLPYLDSRIALPDERLIKDAERRIPDLYERLREYNQQREQYRKEWFTLRDQVTEKLPEDLEEDVKTELVNSLQEIDMGHKTELDALTLQRIDKESNTLANLVLDLNQKPDVSKSWVMNNLDHVRSSLQCVWEDEDLEDKFKELEDEKQNLTQKNRDIIEDLEEARKGFKSKWDLWESEIKEESQL